MMSGPLSTRVSTEERRTPEAGPAGSGPAKSEGSTSIRQAGAAARIAPTVRAIAPAPPSRRSSRATMVTTTWRSPIRTTDSATRRGSSRSTPPGNPVRTEQNRQRRVQTLPSIMKVAVPCVPQHSWMLGQRASSHTVWSFCERTISRTRK